MIRPLAGIDTDDWGSLPAIWTRNRTAWATKLTGLGSDGRGALAPLCRRATQRAFESAIERLLGFVANAQRHRQDARCRLAQQVSGNLETPITEVLHGSASEETVKSLAER